MTATKWLVERTWLTFTEMWVWEITCPEGYCEGAYGTHAEAMAEADRMARTVEVTLPRVGDEHSTVNRGFLTLIFLDGYGSVWLQSEGATFHVLPEEIEETALALLALARRKEQK